MPNTEDIVVRATNDLQRAVSVAEKARDTLAKAEAEASDLRAFLRTMERYAGVTVGSAAMKPAADPDMSRTVRGASRPGSMARKLADTCIEAIKSGGRPLPIGDLLEIVLAAGLPVGGSDQKSNLAGYLSRDPRVRSLGRNIGWTVIEDEGVANESTSQGATPPVDEGGTDDRSTLAPSELDDLLGSSRSQVP